MKSVMIQRSNSNYAQK